MSDSGTCSVRYWPARALGSGAPVGLARLIEVTVALSRVTPTTRSGWKPGHAGSADVVGDRVDQLAERSLPAAG